MSSIQNMREPHSAPLALHVDSNLTGAYPLGVGRGRGLWSSMGRSSVPSSYSVPVGLAAQSASERTVERKENSEYEKKKQILNNYIPGLHRPGENYPDLPTLKLKPANPIPDSLISEYRNGRKNAVMVIHEYASIVKIPVEFTEVAVKNRLTYSAAFACECKVGTKTYPQGVAKTKKDAKKEAARNAFDQILLSFNDNCGDVDESEGAGYSSDDASTVTDAGVDTHGLGNKNPVMMLYEYCSKQSKKLTVHIDEKARADGFHCIFFVDNRQVSEAVALNKKEAKTKAGNEALKVLLNSEKCVSNTHWDKIAQLVHDCAERLFQSQFPKCGWAVLAGFVVKRNQDDIGEVVAIGTGDACLSTQSIRSCPLENVRLGTENLILDDSNEARVPNPNQSLQTDGFVLFDGHAEVVARRALNKWLYQQISILYMSENASASIFEWNPQSGKVRLKETVSIHMYISTAPCGDAATYTFDDSTIIRSEERQAIERGIHEPTFDDPSCHGRLRVKCDIGLTTFPLDRLEVRPTFDELRVGSQNLRTMSCSSKLLKWNVLGLQGSLLSQYVEPIYMSSLTLGSKFHLGHLVRAICCRIPDSINKELPAGFSLRHPYVGRVSVYLPNKEHNLSKNLSINWCAEDQQLEVVDALTGITIPESPFCLKNGPFGRASRLCKRGFQFRFKQLCERTQNLQLVDAFPTYIEKKRAAAEYRCAKLKFFKQLETDSYGKWLNKPENFEQFK